MTTLEALSSSTSRAGKGKANALAALVVAVGSLAIPTVAHADDDKVTRAALASREAEALLAAGKTAEACDKLDESQSLDPRGGTLLDLALCREKEGRIGTAYTLFDEAEKAASAEKRTDRATTAKLRKKELFLKVPRVTVTVPKEAVVDGLEVRFGPVGARVLSLVPNAEWGKPFPTDPGEVKVVVSAPKKATWESTLKLAKGERKTIAIPALKDGEGPTPPPVEVGTPKPADDVGSAKPREEPAKTEPTKTPSGPSKHEAGRVVVDVGLLAGGHLALVAKSPLSDINGTQYIYKGPNASEFLASCGNTQAVPDAGKCDATYDPQLGLLGGAQLFLGYAVTEELQIGGRFMGGLHFPFGFMALGGPSISVKTSPLWIGASLLAGTSQIESTITGARGSVPDAYVGDNGGSDQVRISQSELAGRKGEIPFVCVAENDPAQCTGRATADAFAGFEVGASVEVSVVLVDNPTDGASSGALLLSAWPTGVWAPGHGGAVWLPVGLGYRFY